MLVAIIAALAAALIAVAAVAVVLVVRSRRSSPSVGQTKGVSQLDTVGVGSSPFERRSAAKGAREGDVTVSSSEGFGQALRRAFRALCRVGRRCGRHLRGADLEVVDYADSRQFRIRRCRRAEPVHDGEDAGPARVHLRCHRGGAGYESARPGGARRPRGCRQPGCGAPALHGARAAGQCGRAAHQRHEGRCPEPAYGGGGRASARRGLHRRACRCVPWHLGGGALSTRVPLWSPCGPRARLHEQRGRREFGKSARGSRDPLHRHRGNDRGRGHLRRLSGRRTRREQGDGRCQRATGVGDERHSALQGLRHLPDHQRRGPVRRRQGPGRAHRAFRRCHRHRQGKQGCRGGA